MFDKRQLVAQKPRPEDVDGNTKLHYIATPNPSESPKL